jgi:hypothetical protein
MKFRVLGVIFLLALQLSLFLFSCKLAESASNISAEPALSISCDPNPVPSENGYWHWNIILAAGAEDVSITSLFWENYSEGYLLDQKDLDIEKLLVGGILSAYVKMRIGSGFPVQNVEYAIFRAKGLVGGREVKAEVRVDFIK